MSDSSEGMGGMIGPGSMGREWYSTSGGGNSGGISGDISALYDKWYGPQARDRKFHEAGRDQLLAHLNDPTVPLTHPIAIDAKNRLDQQVAQTREAVARANGLEMGNTQQARLNTRANEASAEANWNSKVGTTTPESLFVLGMTGPTIDAQKLIDPSNLSSAQTSHAKTSAENVAQTTKANQYEMEVKQNARADAENAYTTHTPPRTPEGQKLINEAEYGKKAFDPHLATFQQQNLDRALQTEARRRFVANPKNGNSLEKEYSQLLQEVSKNPKYNAASDAMGFHGGTATIRDFVNSLGNPPTPQVGSVSNTGTSPISGMVTEGTPKETLLNGLVDKGSVTPANTPAINAGIGASGVLSKALGLTNKLFNPSTKTPLTDEILKRMGVMGSPSVAPAMLRNAKSLASRGLAGAGVSMALDKTIPSGHTDATNLDTQSGDIYNALRKYGIAGVSGAASGGLPGTLASMGIQSVMDTGRLAGEGLVSGNADMSPEVSVPNLTSPQATPNGQRPERAFEAVKIVRDMIASGRNVDMNSLAERLGIPPEVFTQMVQSIMRSR